MPFASNGWMSLNFLLEESNAHCKQASKQASKQVVPLKIFLKERNIMPCPLQAIDVLEFFLGRKQCPLHKQANS
jgi:hypothetical protein